MSTAANKIRTVAWTGAFAAITVVGTIYGAGLKTQQEVNEVKKKALEATPDEKVALLEQRKAQLVVQRDLLLEKLARLHGRMADKDGKKNGEKR